MSDIFSGVSLNCELNIYYSFFACAEIYIVYKYTHDNLLKFIHFCKLPN